jgi:hypothetical protein
MFRQGDVLLITMARQEDLGEEVTDPRGLVLAAGETSGHFHALTGPGTKLFRFRDTTQLGRIAFVGKSGAELRVIGGGSGGKDRHTPVALKPGQYLSTVQRSWTEEDEARSRQVAD